MRGSYEDSTVGTMDLDHYDLVQLKHDGMWVQVEIDGRTALVKTRKGNVKARFQLSESQPRSVFVGELMTGTQRSQSRDKEMVVFDCEAANGFDCQGRTYLERMEEFKGIFIPPELAEFGCVFNPVETWNADHALEMWKDVESGAEEGLILRRNVMPFGATVARVKPRAEADYFAGKVFWKNGRAVSIGGALIPDGPIVVRARILCNHDYEGFRLNRVFKCAGQEITKRGSMRFPMFGGWHFEK